MKKKPVVVTIPDVRSVAPRPVVPQGRPGVGYPTAADFISMTSEPTWLETAMRTVLRPIAFAGAVGLAAGGCTGDVVPRIAPLFADDGEPSTSDAGDDGGDVVMFPVPPAPSIGNGAGDGAKRPTTVTHPPHPPQGGGSGQVVATPLPTPDPPPADGPIVQTKPPVVPHVRPPMIRGRIRPVQPAIAMPGVARRVH